MYSLVTLDIPTGYTTEVVGVSEEPGVLLHEVVMTPPDDSNKPYRVEIAMDPLDHVLVLVIDTLNSDGQLTYRHRIAKTMNLDKE
jgi:hypothetical protein